MNSVSILVQILIASAILESVWETVKLMIFAENRENLTTRIGTLVIGLFLAFSYGLDLLAFLGLEDHIPFSGVILSGILLSRGSNFIHDLITRLGNIKETLAVLTPIDMNSKSAENLEPAVKVSTIKE